MLTHPGVVHRAETRLLRLHGDDVTSFLQAITTQELETLPVGASRWAAILDDLAHYVADFWAWRFDACWRLEVEEGRAQGLAERLDRFVISEDVTVETSELIGTHLEGEAALEVAGRELGVAPPPAGEARELEGGALLLCRSLYGLPGITVFAPPQARPLAAVHATAIAAGFAELDREERTRFRIEAGRIRGGVDVTGDDIALEAGLRGAISLDKGCFPGQEIVRRIVARGALKRRLAGVRFPGSSAGERLAGASLHPACAPSSGRVTSAAAAPERAETVALAWVAASCAEPGTSVTARGDFGEVAGSIAALPMAGGGERLSDSIRYEESVP